jgi:hypothetical protein
LHDKRNSKQKLVPKDFQSQCSADENPIMENKMKMIRDETWQILFSLLETSDRG